LIETIKTVTAEVNSTSIRPTYKQVKGSKLLKVIKGGQM